MHNSPVGGRMPFIPASALAFVLLGALTGCSALGFQERPAVLLQSTASEQAELQRAVTEMLNVPSVVIAADALTQSSMLVLESQTARVNGQRLQGRVLSSPERFELLATGSRCVLLHVQTQRRHELQGVRCRPHAQ